MFRARNSPMFYGSLVFLFIAVGVSANSVFTFWEASEFIARDQKPTCESGDLVRIEDTYQFQACYEAEIVNTDTEEPNGVVCTRCTPFFMKYEQAISPCLADNDDLKEVYVEEYDQWVEICPCYIEGRNGKPECGTGALSMSIAAAVVAALTMLL